MKRKDFGAKLLALLKKAGIKVVKSIPARFETGRCSRERCRGTVGKLWPVSLIQQTAPDGRTTQCVLAYPCNKCGALFGNGSGQGDQVTDREGRKVFFMNGWLVYKNKQGRVVEKSNAYLRGSIGNGAVTKKRRRKEKK